MNYDHNHEEQRKATVLKRKEYSDKTAMQKITIALLQMFMYMLLALMLVGIIYFLSVVI